MCNVRNCPEIWYTDPRVSHRFDKDQFSMIVDLFAIALWIAVLHPFDRDTKAWEDAFKQAICTPIEVYRADNIVPCVSETQHRLEDTRLPRGAGHGSGASFKGGYSLFEYLDRGLPRWFVSVVTAYTNYRV